MNVNPNAIRVLCYGDSNTWGRDPHGSGIRYPEDVRWTGLLQTFLGDAYEIIEEGLGGRTTVLDNPEKPDKNGKTFLPICIDTHNPSDIVILFLGTNDLKEIYHRSPEQIAEGIEELVSIIRKSAKSRKYDKTKIIIVSPPLVDESVPGTQQYYKGAEEKSRQLGHYYKKVAAEEECSFIDITEHIQPSKIDGYHLDPEAHKKIAEVFYKKISRL